MNGTTMIETMFLLKSTGYRLIQIGVWGLVGDSERLHYVIFRKTIAVNVTHILMHKVHHVTANRHIV